MIWRDWYSHEVVNTTSGQPTTLSAPLGHINVHIRDGSVLLLHSAPAYTIEETRQGPYSLLISLSSDLQAFGSAYIDDGDSYPPGPHKTLTFTCVKGELRLNSHGAFDIAQKLRDITVLGVPTRPRSVTLGNKTVSGWTYDNALNRLIIQVDLNLNKQATLRWK